MKTKGQREQEKSKQRAWSQIENVILIVRDKAKEQDGLMRTNGGKKSEKREI